jgi:hypothetical protein
LLVASATAAVTREGEAPLVPLPPKLPITVTKKGYVAGTSNQLASGVGDVDGNRWFFDLGFDYHQQDPNVGFENRFVMHALFNDQSALMYSVNEAYLVRPFGLARLEVGRMLLDWSDVDDHWSFGKVNHRQNFNYFEPGREGLLGVMIKRTSNKRGARLHLFFSPLYAPELNPSLDIDKSAGTVTSNNPWAKPPAPTARLEGRDVPIFYDIDYPEISEVVFRSSGGVNVGWEDEHWEAGLYYLFKPENQISTAVEVSYNTGDDIVNADVTPQFYYHHVYGGNLRWRNRDVTIYASAIAVRPNEYPDVSLEAAQYTQLEMEKRREDYVGGGIARSNGRWGTGFDYVARLSPFDRAEDILAEDPRWNQAVHGWGRYKFTDSFEVSGDAKYDMLTTDRLFMFKVVYYPLTMLALTAGVNMIGTPNDGKSYWGPFKNNDSVYSGLRYLF